MRKKMSGKRGSGMANSKKAAPEHRLLEAYQKARAARKKASALEDIARARITSRGYDIDTEYGNPGSEKKMKLVPIAGLQPKKKGK